MAIKLFSSSWPAGAAVHLLGRDDPRGRVEHHSCWNGLDPDGRGLGDGRSGRAAEKSGCPLICSNIYIYMSLEFFELILMLYRYFIDILHHTSTTHVLYAYLFIELDDGKKLQENPIFDGKNNGFRLRFSQQNQSNDLYYLILHLYDYQYHWAIIKRTTRYDQHALPRRHRPLSSRNCIGPTAQMGSEERALTGSSNRKAQRNNIQLSYEQLIWSWNG